MKIDSAGNLFCTGPGGIHVFDSTAQCLGVIRPPERPANFVWGGGDRRSLFMTAITSLFRLKTKIAGQA
jgi:gluconolactonase